MTWNVKVSPAKWKILTISFYFNLFAFVKTLMRSLELVFFGKLHENFNILLK